MSIQSPPASAFSPTSLLWGGDSLNTSSDGTHWLWHGYLARGALTLLTSQWKSGKTTLVSLLLARMQTGGDLAGAPLSAGKAVVLSEEGSHHWQLRHQRLHFGDHVGWFCRPFRGKPRPQDWLAFLDHVVDLHSARVLSLIVIDPLAAFLPGKSENDASSVLEALAPLQRLTAPGPRRLGPPSPPQTGNRAGPGRARQRRPLRLRGHSH